MVEVQSQSLDTISALPQDTIEKILTHMPIQDALRTSILSRKWRHCWKGMPKLVFDDKYLNTSSCSREIRKYKFVTAIFHVLMLHNGPILEFSISINPDTKIVDEIDQIILYLSQSKNIKKFTFKIWSNDIMGLFIFEDYKLPSVFFSLQGLEHIHLTRCVIELPLTFNGFIMLRSLNLCDVNITGKTLQQLLTNCPILEEFILIVCQDITSTPRTKSTFLELSKCLSSVQVLKIAKYYIKYAEDDSMQQKLPTLLVHLRILFLDVCFLKQDELSYALSVISSSPNLEKIKIEIDIKYKVCGEETRNDLLDLQDYSGINLDHLEELEITNFGNYDPEMEFLKLIVAKSPVLKKARIKLNSDVSMDKENKMLRDLLRLTFPRASLGVDIIVER
ncbi:F-box/FBD/LRR-repeat protein At1g13570 [Lactuca sativa]|uniref:F-box/FBD/LRR-repeat protein At1g13570 n=1 Tax=Lactuca sativa TaxID=4236 RepID=UPI000CD960F4|nr:F-box/FBD/LRR-repeat protein At1g13570 [Lactuca sativa]XP_023748272.1 F-box/FBD/LRR-repeat protein At1g13570 [Lactuca sativa]